MPTGITAAIYDGKDVSLRDYLMVVGRQMGYAILQRDDDLTEPVKLTTESSYYARRVPELEARLSELRRMTGAEATEAARLDYEEKRSAWEKTKADKAALRERYEDMLRQVDAWEPDPLIASTKDYAIKYLRESIEFDVARPGEDPMRYYPEPEQKTGSRWRLDELKRTEESLERAREELQRERDRTADRNRHIQAFLHSLPEPDHA